ncbi:MAG: UDP-3-O-(3-hydroxymyristoyl)glucosamine N-acyltransferase [bacterium]|nr:UDP-3-O-(3-hydroxymyristoyl)glucosamine N-acyltransferase [bacterium]
MPEYKLDELADLLNAGLDGDGEVVVRGVNGINEAGPDDLTFVHNPKYAGAIATTRAAAIILDEETDSAGKPALRTDQPYLAFATALKVFAPDQNLPKTVSEQASVSPEAELGEGVGVGPFAVIEKGAIIGARTTVGAGSYIGTGVTVGDDCVIYPNVTVREYCSLGDRVILQPGVVVGGDGFGFAPTPDGIHKVPQIGAVTIADDVEIQANACIDRGTVIDTVIEQSVKVDNLVQLAHNVRIGENTMIASQTGIAGSTVIGKRCIFGGQVGLVGHINVDDDVTFGAQAGVIKDMKGPEVYWGTPARPLKKIKRTEAYVNQLEKLVKRVKELEKKVAELEDS